MEKCKGKKITIESLNATYPHFCYILKSADPKSNYTYNGYTVNLERRIRQHNGEITGGARTTKARRPWEFIMIITSADEKFNRSTGLSFEWHIRYPTNKKPRPKEFQGPEGRIKGIDDAIANFKHDYKFVMAVKKDYYEVACQLENVKNKHIKLYILE
jgi:predicted GIY-YIG superfamily endonuclease